MAVHHIPKGFHAITPYLVVEGAARLLDFVQKAFDAEVVVRMDGPDGKIHHAEVKIGGSVVELADAGEHWSAMPAGVHLYVKDIDATYRRALDAGAVSKLAPADQFYGERSASVKDPLGNIWHIATHTEDVSPEEMKRRVAAMGK
jgi:PhnB protein